MNITIPLETPEGHQYLINISSVGSQMFESELDVEVVFLVLESVNDVSEINSLTSMCQIMGIVWRFMQEHDVILFYYCDRDEDIMKKVHKKRFEESILPQEYRSMLFSKMFERVMLDSDNCEYIDKPIIFRDPQSDIFHFMHLLSHIKHAEQFNTIEKDLKWLAVEMKG